MKLDSSNPVCVHEYFNTAIRIRSLLESQEQDPHFLEENTELKSQWVADEVTFHL